MHGTSNCSQNLCDLTPFLSSEAHTEEPMQDSALRRADWRLRWAGRRREQIGWKTEREWYGKDGLKHVETLKKDTVDCWWEKICTRSRTYHTPKFCSLIWRRGCFFFLRNHEQQWSMGISGQRDHHVTIPLTSQISLDQLFNCLNWLEWSRLGSFLLLLLLLCFWMYVQLTMKHNEFVHLMCLFILYKVIYYNSARQELQRGWTCNVTVE